MTLYGQVILCSFILINPAVLPVGAIIAQVIVLSHPGQIKNGYAPFFMAHTVSFAGVFSELLQKLDRKTGNCKPFH